MARKRKADECLCGTLYHSRLELGKCLVSHLSRWVKKASTAAGSAGLIRCPCSSIAYSIVERNEVYDVRDFAKHMLKKGMLAHVLELELK
jgi:hypothetical protein